MFDHPGNIRRDFGFFRDHRNIHILHSKKLLGQLGSDRFQQPEAGNPPEPGIGVGEVLPDIPFADGSQERIADGVEEYVGIRMTFQALLEGNLHPSQDQLPPRHQGMNVVTETDAHKKVPRVPKVKKRAAVQKCCRAAVTERLARQNGNTAELQHPFNPKLETRNSNLD